MPPFQWSGGISSHTWMHVPPFQTGLSDSLSIGVGSTTTKRRQRSINFIPLELEYFTTPSLCTVYISLWLHRVANYECIRITKWHIFRARSDTPCCSPKPRFGHERPIPKFIVQNSIFSIKILQKISKTVLPQIVIVNFASTDGMNWVCKWVIRSYPTVNFMLYHRLCLLFLLFGFGFQLQLKNGLHAAIAVANTVDRPNRLRIETSNVGTRDDLEECPLQYAIN